MGDSKTFQMPNTSDTYQLPPDKLAAHNSAELRFEPMQRKCPVHLLVLFIESGYSLQMQKFIHIVALLVLASGVLIASPIQDPPKEICKGKLESQSAVGWCLTGELKDCASIPHLTCCNHYHNAMNWMSCGVAAGDTGQKCGTPEKRRPSMLSEVCGSDPNDPTKIVCLFVSFEAECPDHYKNHYALVACGE